MDEKTREILTYINATPQLLSILYDTDLLPEQTLDKPSWGRTVGMVLLYREMAGLEEERLRFYRADGTFEVLASPDEVTQRRVACAKRIAELEALLHLPDSPGSIVLLGLERNRYLTFVQRVAAIPSDEFGLGTEARALLNQR